MRDFVEAMRCVGFMGAGAGFFLVLRGEAGTTLGGVVIVGTLAWFLLCEVLWKMYVWNGQGSDDDDPPVAT